MITLKKLVGLFILWLSLCAGVAPECGYLAQVAADVRAGTVNVAAAGQLISWLLG